MLGVYQNTGKHWQFMALHKVSGLCLLIWLSNRLM